jgi:hypothetical protein
MTLDFSADTRVQQKKGPANAGPSKLAFLQADGLPQKSMPPV